MGRRGFAGWILVMACVLFPVMGCPGTGAASDHRRGHDAMRFAPRLAGTTWSGTDSDGDFYEFTFLSGGQIRYRTNTGRTQIVTFQKRGDVWRQKGARLTMYLGRTKVGRPYSTYVGNIRDNEISGRASNVRGRHWTWKLHRVKR
jgi:hypothetical protein